MAKAGLFAGEVTEQAPADGAITTKFKGYQWMEYGNLYIPPENCNSIWDITTLAPDLHVCGQDLVTGLYNGGILTGIGTIADARQDVVNLTNESGDYTETASDVVGQSYYPNCQAYAYSGRQLLGRCIYNWNMGGTEWFDQGSPVYGLRTGIDGVANEGSTCTDNSVIESSGTLKRSVLSSVFTDGRSIISVLCIPKETGISNYAKFSFRPRNRLSENISVIFSAETGSILIDPVASSATAVAEVRDTDNWWEVYLQVDTFTPNSATQAEIYIYPAWNNDGTTTKDVTATGSIGLGWMNEFSWYSDVPASHTIDMYRGLALERANAIGSVIDESYITISAANFDETEGGVYMEWRPMYSHDEIDTRYPDYDNDVQILSLNDGLGLLYYDWTNELLTSTDGVNTATVPLNLVKETKYRLGVVFGDGLLQVGVDGVWGTSVPYAGSFLTTASWSILGEPFRINYWRELRGYHTTASSAKTEIQLLMNG